MNTAIIENRLTKDEIKALKLAERISVSSKDDCSVSSIRCKLPVDKLTIGETIVEFDVESRMVDYGGSRWNPENVGHRTYRCYTSELHGRSERNPWLAVVAIVRPGDKLSIKWVRSNDCDNYRQAEFHRDECVAVIYRKRREDGAMVEPLCCVTIDTYIGPDNTARMTQTAR